jgi:hypothetical protein
MRPFRPPIAPWAHSTNAPTSASLGDVELRAWTLPGRPLVGLGQRGQAVFLDVADGDLSAGLGEAVREVRAHALGAAGDDDLEVGELHGTRYADARRASSQRASAGYSSRDARLPTTAPT